MKGRELQLRSMLDCFQTAGAQAFIWGPRGVGKTSLGHTSCIAHDEYVEKVGDVPCDENLTFNDFILQVVRQAHSKGRISDRFKNLEAGLSFYGVGLTIKGALNSDNQNVRTTAQAADILTDAFNVKTFPYRKPVVIIDEFDTLENPETITLISSLLKQLSVAGSPLKFVFCGVAKDLTELKVAHASVERYVHAVELRPLTADAIIEIISDVEAEFGLRFSNGQKYRIAQIAGGYPHFAHLILHNVLINAYEDGYETNEVSTSLYKKGVHDSASQAATRLRQAYSTATQKGTDRYVEVLWAAANGPHLERQFKDILSDFRQIMTKRPEREGIGSDVNIRNHLNSLCREANGAVLRRRNPGWYAFTDPMFRSYVRMVADNEGIELGAESFRD
tara:strand:+ start:2355 stop:3527 length:1173 start_codon:yes stop_codon:yes gene_type:complete